MQGEFDDEKGNERASTELLLLLLLLLLLYFPLCTAVLVLKGVWVCALTQHFLFTALPKASLLYGVH